MKRFPLFLLLLNIETSCAQTNTSKPEKVGGPCEGCEAIYESPIPFEHLNAVDTLPGFNEEGTKIVITGKVLKADGKTPAPGVVVYIYHTNQKGIYPKSGNETGWAKRHGYLRAWVKTDAEGNYSFYTLRPGAYPGRTDPEHIHFTIKEPEFNEYYIDDVLFADDPLLTIEQRSRLQQRAGSGIVELSAGKGILVARRDIILGKNIPGHPNRN